ncbi:cytochrome P450 9e2-like [Hyposmocoma kahamanoa]|uniref:cytochrome P450 9e2-like n=1 Tax=Hyposmocoma kahamanoa TaxID=1477025 RepID=UPI000E6D6FB5|nr:cytochrome P450 9e2-like [Hyposmocoma kahamanoa]
MLIWICLGFLVAVLLYFRHVYGFFKSRGIKTPRIVPPFGTLTSVFLQQGHIFENVTKAYNQFPDQRFYGVFQCLTPIVYVRDIELLKKILIKDFEHFLDHNNVIKAEHDPLFARNLVTLRGKEWKDMRSTLSPVFTSSKMKMMLPEMVEVGEQMILSFKKKIKEAEQGYLDVDMSDLTSRYTNDVIASCAFGLKIDSFTDKDNQFYVMGKNTINVNIRQILMAFVFNFFPKLAEIFHLTIFPPATEIFFRTLVTETMQNRDLKQIVRPDMIHLLMEAKKGKLTHDEKSSQDKDTGFATVEESSIGQKRINRAWSDDDLCAQAILFFIAGFETVSSTLSIMLYELAINPDIQERLYQEIKENEAKNNGKFDYNSIQNMVYMDMVVSETLRLWPPSVFLDRYCNKDYNIGKPNEQASDDYVIRKGEAIQIPVAGFHRDPKYYPNPNKFDPERFSEENKHKIQPFTYMPFGLGPRNCIGSRFALCEVKVMVYQLLNAIEISPSDKTIIPPKLNPSSINIRLKGGNWLRFKARNQV